MFWASALQPAAGIFVLCQGSVLFLCGVILELLFVPIRFWAEPPERSDWAHMAGGACTNRPRLCPGDEASIGTFGLRRRTWRGGTAHFSLARESHLFLSLQEPGYGMGVPHVLRLVFALFCWCAAAALLASRGRCPPAGRCLCGLVVTVVRFVGAAVLVLAVVRCFVSAVLARWCVAVAVRWRAWCTPRARLRFEPRLLS